MSKLLSRNAVDTQKVPEMNKVKDASQFASLTNGIMECWKLWDDGMKESET